MLYFLTIIKYNLIISIAKKWDGQGKLSQYSYQG
ncbi:unnamed protein product, partial [marine sediment metagenome]